jgi:hypothetical protein
MDLLRARLRVRSPDLLYFCQSTELRSATEAFPGEHAFWTIRIPASELYSGDLSGFQFSILFVRWVGQRLLRLLGQDKWLRGPSEKTPLQVLNLQPGESVRVKTWSEIAQTLDKKRRNRAMSISAEMMRCCGRKAKVRYRVDRVIDERSAKMRELAATVTLQDVGNDKTLSEECNCEGQFGDCPRGELIFWREIWLERVPGTSQ